MNYMWLQRNKVWIALFGVALLMVIFFGNTYSKDIFFNDSLRSIEPQKSTAEGRLQVTNTARPVTVQSYKSSLDEEPHKAPEVRTVMGSPSEAEIVKKWQMSHGDERFMPMEYKSYSIETLQKLSDAGDIYAMQLLADKIVFRVQNGELKAKSLLMRAAVYGSTNALNAQSINELHTILDAKTEEERKARVIENLVYIKAAALRGDLLHYYRDMGSPLAARSGVVITAADATEINAKAVALIDDLQNQRIALGLGEFDNSQPPEVKHFFENIDPRDLGHKPYF